MNEPREARIVIDGAILTEAQATTVRVELGEIGELYRQRLEEIEDLLTRTKAMRRPFAIDSDRRVELRTADGSVLWRGDLASFEDRDRLVRVTRAMAEAIRARHDPK